nr:CDP-glycerol glycerophosphotransferase family protein [Microbacterium endophyticum]
MAEPTASLLLSGSGARPDRVSLVGRRAHVQAVITGRGQTWKAVMPLRAARWGGPELALPSGDYRVEVIGSADHAQAPFRSTSIGSTVLGDVSASLRDGVVTIGPPLDPAYASAEGQAALERRYAGSTAELENAVFFESFYGRNASCNPLAIDAELARVAPAVVRYWSVVDLSVRVPEGAIAVVEGSPEWWHARASAQLLVVNDWLRRRFVRRKGQRVLQTWHGTPLKRLALHRPGFDPRRALAVIRESRRWDVLLAQSPAAARILRKAYAFLNRPLWVEGYPRNDVLTTGDGLIVREMLGIEPEERVLLYAPTWRDDREQIVDFVDAEKLAMDTDAVVLVRGHSRTLHPGSDAHGARVIDVTGFPDTAQLLLAADALITDYSSVMFDFSATGKPMYFLVPDLEHFRGELRGFYFDLADHAPGPLVQTQEQLAHAILNSQQSAYAKRYSVWRSRFNDRDDGHAAERVVARILDQGFVKR